MMSRDEQDSELTYALVGRVSSNGDQGSGAGAGAESRSTGREQEQVFVSLLLLSARAPAFCSCSWFLLLLLLHTQPTACGFLPSKVVDCIIVFAIKAMKKIKLIFPSLMTVLAVLTLAFSGKA